MENLGKYEITIEGFEERFIGQAESRNKAIAKLYKRYKNIMMK